MKIKYPVQIIGLIFISIPLILFTLFFAWGFTTWGCDMGMIGLIIFSIIDFIVFVFIVIPSIAAYIKRKEKTQVGTTIKSPGSKIVTQDSSEKIKHFCSNCGYSIQKDMVFCINCGNKLNIY